MDVRLNTPRSITVGPILDANGAAVTGTTVDKILIRKQGGTFAAVNAGTTLTHVNTGYYILACNQADFDTLGGVEFILNNTPNTMPIRECHVMPTAVWDALYAASGGYLQAQLANVAHGGAAATLTLSTAAVSGTTTLNSLAVTTTTTLTGAVSLGSTLAVTGTTTLAAVNTGAVTFASLAVTGALSVGTTTTLSGAVSLGSTLGITGAVTLSSTLATGAVTFASVGITGALSVGTTTTLSGAVSLGSTLAVTGTTTLAAFTTGNVTFNGLAITNALSVGTTTTLSGAVSLGSTLGVTGTTTLAAFTTGNVTFNGLAITNALSVGTTTTLSGAVSLGSTLGVTGAVTLSSTLATGAVTFNALTISNNLLISGTTTHTGAVTWTNGGTINNVSGTLSTVTSVTNAVSATLANGDHGGAAATLTLASLSVSGTTSLATVNASGTVTFDAFTISHNMAVGGTTTHTGLVTWSGGGAVNSVTGTLATVTNLTNAVTLANGAHGGAAASITLADATPIKANLTYIHGDELTENAPGELALGLKQMASVFAGTGMTYDVDMRLRSLLVLNDIGPAVTFQATGTNSTGFYCIGTRAGQYNSGQQYGQYNEGLNSSGGVAYGQYNTGTSDSAFYGVGQMNTGSVGGVINWGKSADGVGMENLGTLADVLCDNGTILKLGSVSIIKTEAGAALTAYDSNQGVAKQATLGQPYALDDGSATIAGMILKMADNSPAGDGSQFQAATDSLRQIAAVAGAVSAPVALAATSATASPISGGDVTYTENNDSTLYFTATGTLAAVVQMDFTYNAGEGKLANSLTIIGRYESPTPGAYVVVKAKNQTTGFYETISSVASRINAQVGGTDNTYTFPLNSKHMSTAGLAEIQLLGSDMSATSTLYIDYMPLFFTVGSTAPSDANLIAEAVFNRLRNSVYIDGVYVDTNNGTSGSEVGVNGTPTNPCLYYEEAYTIAMNLGIKKLIFVPDSSVILNPAHNHDNWEFYGKAVIDLGGASLNDAIFTHSELIYGDQLVGSDDIHFNACVMGNASIGPALLENCALSGKITCLAAGNYTFHKCYDGNPTVGDTPSIEFCTNAGVGLRDYRGGMELWKMDASNEIKLDGAGRVVINENCTGGDITIRGFFPPVQDLTLAGFAGTVHQTQRFDGTIIDGISDTLGTAGSGLTNLGDPRLDILDTTTDSIYAELTHLADDIGPDGAGLTNLGDPRLEEITGLVETIGVAGAGLTHLGDPRLETLDTTTDSIHVELEALAADIGTDGVGLTNLGDTRLDLLAEGFGVGTVRVDHNYGGTNALAYVTSEGEGVKNGIIQAFLETDWNAGLRDGEAIRAATRTDINGQWVEAMMLDEATYVLQYYKVGVYNPSTTTITVVAS